MLRPKKNSYKEFDKEKKIPEARKFPLPPPPPPPITFLMVRPQVHGMNSAPQKERARLQRELLNNNNNNKSFKTKHSTFRINNRA